MYVVKDKIGSVGIDTAFDKIDEVGDSLVPADGRILVNARSNCDTDTRFANRRFDSEDSFDVCGCTCLAYDSRPESCQAKSSSQMKAVLLIPQSTRI